MTFGLIGEVFGTIGDILGYQRKSGAFVPDWCPILREGETHPHMLHSSRTDDKAQTYMLNTIVDLQMLSMEYCNTMGEAIIAQGDRSEAMFEFHQKQYKKLQKSLKSFSFSGGKDIEDVLIKLDQKLKELNKKISALDQVIESTDKVAKAIDDLDNMEINKAIITATRKIEAQEKMLGEISKQLKAQSKASSSFTPEVIQENLGKAFKKQDSKIAQELEDLQSKIKELLDEVKFDPDNPKPTELRTEENSKQILEISSKLVPLIESCQKAINESNELLDKIKKRIA